MSPSLGLLTCSFAADFDLCKTLVSSVQMFTPEVYHRILVPPADLGLFAEFASPSTEIVANRDFLPPGCRALPRAPEAIRTRLPKLRRPAYLYRGRIVRGWLMQQVVKLAAAASMPTPMVMHCDSDSFLVRAPRMVDYWNVGKPRLLSRPGGGRDEVHYLWHAAAASLLGLTPTTYFGNDWVGALVTWHRQTVRDLLEAVEHTAGKSWYDAVLSNHDFSEYTLYGAYVEFSGRCRTPHYATAQSLSLNNWGEPLDTAEQVARFCADLRPEHLGG